MALRTLMHHTRTIKAVSKAVCADVRVLETTVAKPAKWLEGLWLVEAGTRTRDEALEECVERAQVARRGNTVVELYTRLESCTDRFGAEVVVKCPAPLPEQRAEAVGWLVKFKEHSDNKDNELSWAHTRCKPAEEVHAVAPIETSSSGIWLA